MAGLVRGGTTTTRSSPPPLNLPQSRARSRPFVPDVRPWSLPLTKPRHLQLADPGGGRERSARHCPPGRPDRGEGLGRSVSASRAARSEWGRALYTFGHSRGPLWRFCEAVFTLDPSKSRIPGCGWADATNAPQICELQVTGFRRPGRPRRRPPAGAAGQALDENVGTARGVKRAAGCGKDCGSEASMSECLATGFDSSSQPPQAGFGATSTSGSRADPRERGPPCAGGYGRRAEAGACRSS